MVDILRHFPYKSPISHGEIPMTKIVNIKTLQHTTEVTFDDGSVANQFHINWLVRERDGSLQHSMEGTITNYEDFLKTIENSRKLLWNKADPIVYEDDTAVHTTTGGYTVAYSYAPLLEEKITASKHEWDRRCAEMMARVEASRAERFQAVAFPVDL